MPSYAVVGASRGIGLGFVRQLSAAAENHVFAIVRNRSTATDLATYAQANANVYVLEADITDVQALKAAAAETAKITGGSLDVLINNAAMMPRSAVEITRLDEQDPDHLRNDLNEIISVNALGTVNSTNAFLPLLRNGTQKKIISISSNLSDPEFTGASGIGLGVSYSVSKAALNMIVAKYAVQFKEEELIFLSLSPGIVNTGGPGFEQTLERWRKMEPIFKKINPSYNGWLSVDESVRLQLEVIKDLTLEESGSYKNVQF